MPTGPVCFNGPGSPVASCVFDYQLDPAATNDPTVAWHAFWTTTTGPACTKRLLHDPDDPDPRVERAGSDAKLSADGLERWQRAAGAASAVDAAGHATTPGSLTQAAGWPAGIVTAVTYPGALVVVWQGRTTRAVPATLAAEVANPGTTRPFVLPPQPSEIGVPCANLPPPGPGFLARVVPSTVKFGGTAWVQMRIPGTGYRLGPPSKGVRSIAGTATVAYGSGGSRDAVRGLRPHGRAAPDARGGGD